MARRDEIVAYANELLEVERFPEFAPQGLQVVGAADVTTIACGVSCSRDLFEQAVGLGAQLLLVHHGLFWRNEPLVVDARLRGRLEALFAGDASLVAYHLALDAHPTLGNNAQLAARIGAMPIGPFGGVGLGCTLDAGPGRRARRRGSPKWSGARRSSSAAATARSGASRSRPAPPGTTSSRPRTRATTRCSPASPRSRARPRRRELGIHLIAAGHHATEQFGVQALAAHLAERFDLEWHYVEIENPI